MRLTVNEASASWAYVEQQRKRRDENTSRPSRLPSKPSAKRAMQMALMTTISESIGRSVCSALEKNDDGSDMMEREETRSCLLLRSCLSRTSGERREKRTISSSSLTQSFECAIWKFFHMIKCKYPRAWTLPFSTELTQFVQVSECLSLRVCRI